MMVGRCLAPASPAVGTHRWVAAAADDDAAATAVVGL